ncbi:MAG: hypothetical protein G01um101431_279 [Parcubacteria group bacterium Gr01-1014_31]|nr:MAG: hypothetical protein G01um101431_279 [Parcubacteria group bacterium Gr01-1014_31]
MRIPRTKLKAMIRFFCSNTDPNLLGKTKLMKLFYFADFTHVKKFGVPITYDRYVHLERGPVPSNILNLVNSVIDEPETALLSDTISVRFVDGRNFQKIICLKPFTASDNEYFTERELQTLKDVCQRFSDKNTKYIVEASHGESAWINTKEPTEIPYSLAALDNDSKITEEEIKILVSLK